MTATNKTSSNHIHVRRQLYVKYSITIYTQQYDSKQSLWFNGTHTMY